MFDIIWSNNVILVVNTILTNYHFSKQLPSYTSSRLGATKALIWSRVSSHLVNVILIFNHFYMAAKCSTIMFTGDSWYLTLHGAGQVVSATVCLSPTPSEQNRNNELQVTKTLHRAEGSCRVG